MAPSWDDVEVLHDVIAAYAGPLTQLLHGYLPATLTDATALAVWQDVFRCDWDGDLPALPRLPPHGGLCQSFRLITSRRMYEHVKRRSDYNEVAYRVDYADGHDGSGARAMVRVLDIDHVPMQHMWLDELTALLAHPVALAHAAIAGGHVTLLRHLQASTEVDLGQIQHLHGRDGLAMDVAAYHGHLDVLKLLHDAGSTACTTDAMDHAAFAGDLRMVQWLGDHRSEGCTANALLLALANGHVDVADHVRRVYGDHFSFQAYDIEAAVLRGHLNVLTYVVTHFSQAIEISETALTYAAAYGRLDMLALLLSSPAAGSVPSSAMIGAAAHGHLDVITFLHAHPAAQRGFGPRILDAAARNNHMAIVLFLHERRSDGCTPNALDRAAHRGHGAMVQFLKTHRSEGGTTRAIDWAAAAGHLEIVRFLYTHPTNDGCTFRALYWAARGGHMDVLAFLAARDPQRRGARKATRRALHIGHKLVFDNLSLAGCTTQADREAAATTEWFPIAWRIRSDLSDDQGTYGDDDDDLFEDGYGYYDH
ncbi:hypothetical protein SDRG_00300 [Saprolegnia diclina VS20]|uniref:Uncharacterized protein n=1 Tax=Saprolegnia diclina (strain VS20) TaxID=1156394 RepID=T0R7X7_SAPDV|nr:hypothetical protein SDRG_00300 [Saprolegnia diclina VS20]EQC42570.1 hypothetical protein SDRG_00300 [Saprolegnia diclina VS20]|eukprot:XP_008603993.1 hypothetical protein SDRG_00300 [Saprolegnia diclina VS20]